MGLTEGIERTDEFRVEGDLLTDVDGTLPLPVLSTPGMISMMEWAATRLVVRAAARSRDGRLRGLHQARRRGARGRDVHGDARAARGDRGAQAALRRRGQGRRAHDRGRHARAARHPRYPLKAGWDPPIRARLDVDAAGPVVSLKVFPLFADKSGHCTRPRVALATKGKPAVSSIPASPARKSHRRRLTAWLAFGAAGLATGAVWATGFASAPAPTAPPRSRPR